MKPQIIVGVVAAVVILAGLGLFLSQRPNTQVSPSPSPAARTSSTSNPQSLKDLMTAGGSVQCTFPEGVFYAASGKARGDFSTTTDGKVTKTHLIVDGKTSYLWMDNSTTGYKMSFDLAASSTPAQNQAVDLDKKVDYQCQLWNVDNSLFVLPTTVKFTDFGTLGGQTPTSSASNQAACAACDSAPESARAQCKAALNCQ